jgi:Ser/Thr protein kinase RdoA (MazF antagonist)
MQNKDASGEHLQLSMLTTVAGTVENMDLKLDHDYFSQIGELEARLHSHLQYTIALL